MNFSAHKLDYGMGIALTVLAVWLMLRWLYRRLYSRKNSFHEAQLVRFQIFFACLASVLVGTLLLLFNTVFASGH